MSSTANGLTAADLSPDAVWYLIHHVFLPPKVPQADDYDASLDVTLLKAIIHGLNVLKGRLPTEKLVPINNALAMLRNMQKVHISGNVNETELLQALASLIQDGQSTARSIKRVHLSTFANLGRWLRSSPHPSPECGCANKQRA